MSEPLSHDDMVEIFTAPTPREVSALREAQPERRLYKTTGYEDAVPDDAFIGSEKPHEARVQAASEMRQVFADIGLAPVEVRQLMNRAAEVRNSGISEQQARGEARKQLARQFGPGPDAQRQADAAMADARRLVTRDPRFTRWLVQSGLGNDSETLVQFAKLATSQRAKGFLK